MTEEELRKACLAGYDALSSLVWEVRRLTAEVRRLRAELDAVNIKTSVHLGAMSDGELKRHLANCLVAIHHIGTASSGQRSLDAIARELARIRSELASERTKHQDLWQFVDEWADRMYCELKGIEK